MKEPKMRRPRVITMTGYEDGYGFNPWEEPAPPLPPSEQHGTTFHRGAMICTNPHYTDKVFMDNPDQSIFGQKEDDLEYAYNDRLQEWDYKKWKEAVAAMEAFAQEKAAGCSIQPWAFLPRAEAHEVLLTAYFGRPVELVHILAGINRSNLFSYLVYGYRWREEPETEGLVKNIQE